MKKIDIEKVKEMYCKENKSTNDIAKYFGTYSTKICRIMEKNCLKRRDNKNKEKFAEVH